jgi:spore coat polysaccharide biosynthesis protein SpsF
VANLRTIAVVQSRMTSSRLPGKALINLGGRPAIEQLLRRLQAVPEIDKIIVATTTNTDDDVLIDYLNGIGVSSSRGSESDVLGRVAQTISDIECEYVVKVTADCPVLDPEIASSVISVAHSNKYDFVSNGIVRSFPDGMDCSVVRKTALLQSAIDAVDPLEREHTSLHIRRNPNIYSQHNVHAPPDLYWPELGLTLDTLEDHTLIESVFNELGPDRLFSCSEMVALLRIKPELLQINSHVVRKGDS